MIEAALARDRSRAHIELLLVHGAPVALGDATLAVRRGRADLLDLLGPASPSPADELLGALRRADRPAVDAVLAAIPAGSSAWSKATATCSCTPRPRATSLPRG